MRLSGRVTSGSLSVRRTGGEPRVASGERECGMPFSDEEPRGLAEEQAALRRVATLVARGVSPEEVFAAVIGEAGRVLSAGYAHLGRYEADGLFHLAGHRRGAPVGPGGRRLAVRGGERRKPRRAGGFSGADRRRAGGGVRSGTRHLPRDPPGDLVREGPGAGAAGAGPPLAGAGWSCAPGRGCPAQMRRWCGPGPP
jgi:hypothetical protein